MLARKFINALKLSCGVPPNLAPLSLDDFLLSFQMEIKLKISRSSFAWTICMMYRNINLLSIGYGFRLDLRTD